MHSSQSTRRNFLKCSFGAALSPMLLSGTANAQPAKRRKNALFIIIEDLNNSIGCYGNPLVQTPNLDRLARKGLIFDRAYCQFPVCNPSRSSFLTGLRPDTTKVLDNSKPWHTHVNHETLPKLFKDNGYYTVGLGKVFHGRGRHDDPQAWDVNMGFEQTERGKRGEGRNMTDGEIPWCNWLAAEGTDEDQPDGQIAAKAVELLKQPHDKPFFMALGFHKPHDPFHAPKKYFDMYNKNELMPPLVPDNRSPKEDFMIGSGWHGPMKDFTLQDQREFLWSYYACATFVDAQIGKVIDEMDRQDLWKDTAVILVSDHGYNLGEYDWWNKAVLMEDSARIPMIAVVEGQTPVNMRCDRFVEMVDLYPTFTDLCGLTCPENLEGTSIAPLLSDPNIPWKKAAYTQVQRGGDITGKSVRTKRWRYNEWTRNQRVIARELFDHSSDPQEYRNLAEMEDFKDICRELSALL